MLELKNVSLVKAGQSILTDVSLKIESGEFAAVVGPSGAGKTSLFRLLNLLDSPTGGQISYRGKALVDYDPLTLRREVGYVFQKPYLFGRTIAENLEYPYKLRRVSPDRAEITAYLKRANLSEQILTQKPTELSGGEQQRVSLLRSLLVKPRVLLLDEVTASLDEGNTKTVEELVRAEKASNDLTVLMITHNLAQAGRLAAKFLHLEGGRLKNTGPTAELRGELQ